MGLVEGQTILVTGVLKHTSIAFHVARLAQEQGANVILTSFGRQMKLTEITSRRLPTTAPVVQLDVTDDDDLRALESRLRQHTDKVDSVIHSIGFAPQSVIGGKFLEAQWPDVAIAMQVSAYSIKSLAMAVKPLMSSGSSLVGLTFDGSFAWPVYDWMGVAKAAFESTSRYLARDLGADGIRVNLVSAGPIRTTAATSIPGFDEMESKWDDRAPLGWDVTDPEPTAKTVLALCSQWLPATTGEIVHADGGVHAMGQ